MRANVRVTTPTSGMTNPCRLFSAARECGYADALERLEEVNGQIRQTVAEAFEIKAKTSFDVAVQA
jgi:hypothetical protein